MNPLRALAVAVLAVLAIGFTCSSVVSSQRYHTRIGFGLGVAFGWLAIMVATS